MLQKINIYLKLDKLFKTLETLILTTLKISLIIITS